VKDMILPAVGFDIPLPSIPEFCQLDQGGVSMQEFGPTDDLSYYYLSRVAFEDAACLGVL
jgi:hypothetical protein